MRRVRGSSAIAVVLSLAAACATARVRERAPERVIIRSERGYVPRTLIILPTPEGFSDGTRRLDAKLVRAFVDRATAPPVASVDRAALGVDATALRRMAERHAAAAYPPRTAARLVARVCDPASWTALARTLFRDFRAVDDYPTVTVDLVLAGGESIRISSRAQAALMLPWRIERGDGTVVSYDPALSRAIAALLPPGFVNRERVAGSGLARDLFWASQWLWGRELASSAAAEESGPVRALLAPRFTIAQPGSDVSDFNARPASDFERRPKIWAAILTTPSLGAIRFQLMLSETDHRLADAAPFLRDADGLVARVRALPWVVRYLATHPRATLTIDYYDDRSISPVAQAAVLARLRADGRAELAATLAPLLARSIGLQVQDGERHAVWIVLPDGTSLLHFTSSLEADGVPGARTGARIDAGGALIP